MDRSQGVHGSHVAKGRTESESMRLEQPQESRDDREGEEYEHENGLYGLRVMVLPMRHQSPHFRSPLSGLLSIQRIVSPASPLERSADALSQAYRPRYGFGGQMAAPHQYWGPTFPPATAVPEIGVTGAPKVSVAAASTNVSAIANTVFMFPLLECR